MKKKLLAGLAVGLLMLGMAGVAKADTISSNLMFPSYASYWGIPSFVKMAFSFTVPLTSNYNLDSIGIPLGVAEGPHSASIKILKDDNNLPGQDIESFLVDRPMYSTILTVIESTSKPTLLAGQQYWLSITPENPATTLSLRWALDPAGQVAYSLYDGAWALSTVSQSYSPGAFEISGTPSPVPEPATILLMGTGLTGLFAARRKKKA